jgi:enoyl-CoA hydratase/3-hydroxyacyl-CoA dehydrogenase
VDLAAAVAERWSVPLPGMLDRQRRQGPFRFELVRLDVRDGVGTITINRPDAMNALNLEVIRQLGERFDEAVKRDDVRGIVLAGAGKAFVAGADIRFFVKNIENDDIAAIRRMTEAGQELYRRIDESPKTVVAKLDGLSLGGGSELALCADYIIASPRGSLGFPETGIGIYPGLGGTQRTRQRVGEPLTHYLVMTGDVMVAERALDIGLVDEIAPIAELDAVVRTCALERPPVRDRQPGKAKAFAAERAFFEQHAPEAILEGAVETTGEVEARIVKRVRAKAPIAVRRAAELIREGARLPLAEGLALELSFLDEIFGTEDALLGLRSVGRERPSFQGR